MKNAINLINTLLETEEKFDFRIIEKNKHEDYGGGKYWELKTYILDTGLTVTLQENLLDDPTELIEKVIPFWATGVQISDDGASEDANYILGLIKKYRNFYVGSCNGMVVSVVKDLDKYERGEDENNSFFTYQQAHRLKDFFKHFKQKVENNESKIFEEKDLVKTQMGIWEKAVPLPIRLDIKNKNFPIERHGEVSFDHGWSLLQMAIAWSEDLDCVKYLISTGVDLSYRDDIGGDVLTSAVGRMNPSRIEMTQLLLGHNVELNNHIKDEGYAGFTALHIACWGLNEIDVIKLLVEAGADINAKDADGCTPYHVANNKGRCPGLKDYLLANGAVK